MRSPRWHLAAAGPREAGPQDGREVVGHVVEVPCEHAPNAGAAARSEDQILAEQRLGFVACSGDEGVHRGPRESPVRRQIVELLHHLRLRHHRKSAEVGQFERVDVADVSAESTGVERRAIDRGSQQPTQRSGLMGDDLIGRPSESLEMPGEAVEEGLTGWCKRVDGRDGSRHGASSTVDRW